MRVLMYEPTGGFWPYSDDISEYIARLGVDVLLLTSKLRASYGSQIPRKYRMFALTRPMNRNMRYADTIFSRGLWAADRVTSAAQWLASRHGLAGQTRPDLVHVQSTVPVLDRYVLPRLARRYPVVLTVHDVLPVTDTRSVGSRSALKTIYDSAGHLIVHAESNRQELVSEFGVEAHRVSVIPHGVVPYEGDLSPVEARKNLNLPLDAELLLAFGSLRRGKGLDVAIRALALVSSERPAVRLVVAGSPPNDGSIEDYKSLAARVGVSDRIDWRLGYVPDALVASFFRAADAALLPYTRFHSQSGVLLQAYRYGTPVVVTNVGALGESVREDQTGIVAPQPIPEDLAQAAMALLRNEQFRLGCVRHANELARGRYNWNTVAAATVGIYCSLLADSWPPSATETT